MHATGSTAAGRRGASGHGSAAGERPPAGVGYIHVSRTPPARPPEARIPAPDSPPTASSRPPPTSPTRPGYENVTLSALARRFNVKDASLYAHVRGLRDLRTRMALLAGAR